MPQLHDILIIGSGAAGYTAAIYAARANRKPLLLSGLQRGGQLTITTEVENYPGFGEPIMGPALMDRMRDQAARQGATLIEELSQVERVDLSGRPFGVWMDDGTEYRAKTLIIATGASAKWLGLPSEQALMGYGVSACATCDGPFFRGKRAVVIGGGDTALEEANYLTQPCGEVIVVHRRDSLRASQAMQDRAQRNPKIRFIWDTEVLEILGTDKPAVRGVSLRNLKTGATSELTTDAVFVAIGHEPNTAFLAGQLPTDPRGYLLTEPGRTQTSILGVFAAGDVADPFYRQAVTAAGMGCMAAIEAEHLLQHEAHAEPGAALSPHGAER